MAACGGSGVGGESEGAESRVDVAVDENGVTGNKFITILPLSHSKTSPRATTKQKKFSDARGA